MSKAHQATFSRFPATEDDGSDLTLRQRLLRYTRQSAREWYWSEYDRESYTCPTCGSSGPFDVHHRDGDAFNNHPLNLIGICVWCHHHEHRRRETVTQLTQWKREFSQAMGVER